MLLFILDIMFVSSVALFSSVYFRSYIPAMLMTWGIYIVSGLVTIAERVPVIKHFPGMIKSNMGHILYGMPDTGDIIWNIVVVFGLIAVFIGLSIKKIRNQDI
jgi:ABC-2 type transport system permease protein